MPDTPEMREAFEKWYADQGGETPDAVAYYRKGDSYWADGIQRAWIDFQAGHAAGYEQRLSRYKAVAEAARNLRTAGKAWRDSIGGELLRESAALVALRDADVALTDALAALDAEEK